MAKHKNPLEKEFLIRQYKSNPGIKIRDFCVKNNISVGAFQKWLKQYEEGGIEGLARADAEIKEVLPEGIDRTVVVKLFCNTLFDKYLTVTSLHRC